MMVLTEWMLGGQINHRYSSIQSNDRQKKSSDMNENLKLN